MVCTKEIDDNRSGSDACGLTDIKRRRKQTHGGAARLRRHQRGISLQRVVQHVEAEPDRGGGHWREPPDPSTASVR